MSLLDKLPLVCNQFRMLFALAAQLSAPTLMNRRVGDVRAIFSYDDVPGYLVQQAPVDRTVYTRTTVRPDGTIQSCVAESSSGDPRLDAYTCRIIVKRAKFVPARWPDGSAAYGVIREPVRWRVTDSPSEDDRGLPVPDLAFSVNRLPAGAHSATVDLQVAANETGRPLSCVEGPPAPPDDNKRFPELVALACRQATETLRLSPPVDGSGKAVRSIQTVSVRFRVGT